MNLGICKKKSHQVSSDEWSSFIVSWTLFSAVLNHSDGFLFIFCIVWTFCSATCCFFKKKKKHVQLKAVRWHLCCFIACCTHIWLICCRVIELWALPESWTMLFFCSGVSVVVFFTWQWVIECQVTSQCKKDLACSFLIVSIMQHLLTI